MTQVRFSVGRFLPDGRGAAYGAVGEPTLAYAVYSATDWPHIEQQITAGRLPAAWFAPPVDTPAGVKTTPQLIP